MPPSKAEKARHAKNWLMRNLANYDENRYKQFLEPKVEAMRLEQYFRIELNANAVLVLHEAFVDYPRHFQMFIYLFWAKYWDNVDGVWKCVDASRSVVICCERFWLDAQSLPAGLMPCPVV